MTHIRVAIIRFWLATRITLANLIYRHEIPFNIAHTKITEDGEYAPIPYKFKVLAEFDLPNSNRHYAIYIDRKNDV